MHKVPVSGEYKAFTKLVDSLLSVPRSVIQERVQAHRKVASQNPNRPGPKPKRRSVKRGRASRDRA